MYEKLRAVAVFKNGRSYPVQNTLLMFPNYCQKDGALERWQQLVIRDEQPPNFSVSNSSSTTTTVTTRGSANNGEADPEMRPSKRAKT